MSQDNPPSPIELDLRGMAPPEPMEHALEALADLLPMQRLHLVIDREPRPLFRIVERDGLAWRCTPRDDGAFDVVIGKSL